MAVFLRDAALARIHDELGLVQPTKPHPFDGPRVAIYMTTHLSVEHVAFLTKCWPAATERLPLLAASDLILYTSFNPPQALLKPLQFQNIIIRRYRQPLNGTLLSNGTFDPRQAGAIQAMTDPFQPGAEWFADYDWIIRLNPDVLIRDDTFLRQAMRDDSIDAVFAVCERGVVVAPRPNDALLLRGRLHTDFTAFRPSAVNVTALLSKALMTGNAEQHLTNSMVDILNSGRYRVLPGAHKHGKYCRVVGVDSPVVHVHQLVDHCPDYFHVHDPEGQW